MQVVFIIIFLCLVPNFTSLKLFKTTGDRIASHGYPWENHTVQTLDGYILTLFRIPYSHRLGNQMVPNKSAVLLQHGLMASSDCWILNGPNDGLPFMLADSGYDVWIGNARGTRYSQRHVTKSPLFSPFWDFSWDEIGFYDMPAMLDHIIAATHQNAIHYVGHSQGTTTLIVMLSTHPEYNKKIKTAHLLAPSIFMGHMRSPPVVFLSHFLEKPNILTSLMGSSKFISTNALLHVFAPSFCRKQPAHEMCTNALFIAFGGVSPYLNDTLLESLLETHPADASVHQIIHFIQERNSKQFCYYDYGPFYNLLRYGRIEPPLYELKNVNTQRPINFYYSDNDDWVAVEDIHHLKNIMGSEMSPHKILLPEFNHLDFLFGINVKEVINACIVDQINESEGKPFYGYLCHFKNL